MWGGEYVSIPNGRYFHRQCGHPLYVRGGVVFGAAAEIAPDAALAAMPQDNRCPGCGAVVTAQDLEREGRQVLRSRGQGLGE